jgi:hypothetical protein
LLVGQLGVKGFTHHLLEDLVATTPPKDREIEAATARARAQARFASA